MTSSRNTCKFFVMYQLEDSKKYCIMYKHVRNAFISTLNHYFGFERGSIKNYVIRSMWKKKRKKL